jgi:hypothetical protein
MGQTTLQILLLAVLFFSCSGTRIKQQEPINYCEDLNYHFRLSYQQDSAVLKKEETPSKRWGVLVLREWGKGKIGLDSLPKYSSQLKKNPLAQQFILQCHQGICEYQGKLFCSTPLKNEKNYTLMAFIKHPLGTSPFPESGDLVAVSRGNSGVPLNSQLKDQFLFLEKWRMLPKDQRPLFQRKSSPLSFRICPAGVKRELRDTAHCLKNYFERPVFYREVRDTWGMKFPTKEILIDLPHSGKLSLYACDGKRPSKTLLLNKELKTGQHTYVFERKNFNLESEDFLLYAKLDEMREDLIFFTRNFSLLNEHKKYQNRKREMISRCQMNLFGR